jgi:hypothetical protein
VWRFSSPQTLVSTASTIWEIRWWFGGVDFRGRVFSALSAPGERSARTRRTVHAAPVRLVFFVFLLTFRFDPLRFWVSVGRSFGRSAAEGGRSTGSTRTVRQAHKLYVYFLMEKIDPLFSYSVNLVVVGKSLVSSVIHEEHGCSSFPWSPSLLQWIFLVMMCCHSMRCNVLSCDILFLSHCIALQINT